MSLRFCLSLQCYRATDADLCFSVNGSVVFLRKSYLINGLYIDYKSNLCYLDLVTLLICSKLESIELPISPEQCRMVRSGLKWSQAELARRSGVVLQLSRILNREFDLHTLEPLKTLR